MGVPTSTYIKQQTTTAREQLTKHLHSNAWRNSIVIMISNHIYIHCWFFQGHAHYLSKDRFGCGLSQWETTLHSNVSHWLSPCSEWSLLTTVIFEILNRYNIPQHIRNFATYSTIAIYRYYIWSIRRCNIREYTFPCKLEPRGMKMQARF